MRPSFRSRSRLPRCAGLTTAACGLLLLFLTLARPAVSGNVRTAGPLAGNPVGASVTLLGDGRILIFGGGAASIWEPESRQWMPLKEAQQLPRRSLHTTTRFGDERILFVGGLDANGDRWNQQ